MEPRLSTYMGLVFEDFLQQTWEYLPVNADVPSVREWLRFEGLDQNRKPVEIDIVAPLINGGMLTGTVKWNEKPAILEPLLMNHVRALERLAESGLTWAQQALAEGSHILVLSASGFVDEAYEMTQIKNRVHLVPLQNLYSSQNSLTQAKYLICAPALGQMK